MSSEEKEHANEKGFQSAIQRLATVNGLSAIQKAAKEIVEADISICYSKLSGYEHKFCFVIHAREDVDTDDISKLMSRIVGILSYDEVSVQEEALLSKARFELQHSSLVSVSSKNYEGVNTFLKEYDAYLKRKLVRSERKLSPELDNFVDVQVKRVRMEDK